MRVAISLQSFKDDTVRKIIIESPRAIRSSAGKWESGTTLTINKYRPNGSTREIQTYLTPHDIQALIVALSSALCAEIYERQANITELESK
jgi:hypothetical protein